MGCGCSSAVEKRQYPSFYEKYTLDDKLGEGSYGKVYKTFTKKSNHVFAVKAQVLRSSRQEEDFAEEVKAWRILGSHPNIVGLLDVCQELNVVFMLMKPCSQSLFDKIVLDPKWTATDLMLDFSQVLSGLDHMHQRRVIHRDVKVQNILYGMEDERTLKINDFGLSRVVPAGTELENVCGSPAMMAPEMLEKKGYSLTIDIWALGVTYFMVLTGELLVGEPNMTGCQMKKAVQAPGPTDRAMSRALLQAERCIGEVRSLKLLALDLVRKMTMVDASRRLSAAEALNDKFLALRHAEETERKKLDATILINRLIASDRSDERLAEPELDQYVPPSRQPCEGLLTPHQRKRLRKRLLTPFAISGRAESASKSSGIGSRSTRASSQSGPSRRSQRTERLRSPSQLPVVNFSAGSSTRPRSTNQREASNDEIMVDLPNEVYSDGGDDNLLVPLDDRRDPNTCHREDPHENVMADIPNEVYSAAGDDNLLVPLDDRRTGNSDHKQSASSLLSPVPVIS
eukprot:TRINITY_DN3695_c0_g1_i1.p1 TRINITY_DN3695_c0_g1~~TRINITY_DN3695_c0_g1_i1.p1  ORF type:complete len:513 (-),score=99.44 TRINITY_DN3695_c0_g1_i1:62-1600(-)